MFESLTFSVELKRAICEGTEKTSNEILFDDVFGNSSEIGKEYWRWIVMDGLKYISEKWKRRLQEGKRDPRRERKFFSMVSVSDIAFLLVVTDFFRNSFDLDDCIKQHKEWSSGQMKIKPESEGGLENEPDDEGMEIKQAALEDSIVLSEAVWKRKREGERADYESRGGECINCP